MGYWYRSLITIFICAIFVGVVFAQDEDDDLSPDGNIVVVDSAFVRGGPSNDYAAVGALFQGDEVFPQNISEDGLWILIPYSRGHGWVQRNLVRWEDEFELNQLPVLAANITPTPRIAITNTPFVPTATPEGNYVNVEGAASAYVRAGPGRGYLRLGQLLPGETVEPLARNEETTWIMIRYSDEVLIDGFAWVAVDLVNWLDFEALSDLPLVLPDDLTPTVTFTPSPTASITSTTTITSTPTSTPSNTASSEPSATSTTTPSNTPTITETLEPTVTNTAVPSETATIEPTPSDTATSEPTFVPSETHTAVPSETPTPEPSVTDTIVPSDTPSATNTALPSETPSNTASPEPSVTDTLFPSETHTALPSETPTPEPSATDTLVPSDTPTQVVEAAIVASETASPSPTDTATPTMTASATSTPTEAITDIFAIQETSVAEESTASALSVTSDPPDPNILEETPLEEGNRIPVEAIVGIILLLLVLAYVWFYWQGLAAAGRYADGFVIDECPVCRRGHLEVDERHSRTFGIPTVRRTVKCDACRSVLRETGTQRWRYAVDRIENATMYDRFNGRVVSDTDLERLVKTPPTGAKARTSPEFEENNPDE